MDGIQFSFGIGAFPFAMMGGVSAPCLHVKLVTIATITDPTHLIMGGAVTQCHSLSPRSRCSKCLVTDLEVYTSLCAPPSSLLLCHSSSSSPCRSEADEPSDEGAAAETGRHVCHNCHPHPRSDCLLIAVFHGDNHKNYQCLLLVCITCHHHAFVLTII